jgi:hypothetical protein
MAEQGDEGSGKCGHHQHNACHPQRAAVLEYPHPGSEVAGSPQPLVNLIEPPSVQGDDTCAGDDAPERTVPARREVDNTAHDSQGRQSDVPNVERRPLGDGQRLTHQHEQATQDGDDTAPETLSARGTTLRFRRRCFPTLFTKSWTVHSLTAK